MRLVISSKLLSQSQAVKIILHGPSDQTTFKFCHQVTNTIMITRVSMTMEAPEMIQKIHVLKNWIKRKKLVRHGAEILHRGNEKKKVTIHHRHKQGKTNL
jgi:hypothetical protein